MLCNGQLKIKMISKQILYFWIQLIWLNSGQTILFDQFQIKQKNKMLKKVKTSHRLPSQPSLKNIIDDSKNINRTNQLKQLFVPQYREIFELSYLVKSPHYQQDKFYTELVDIIQKYNTQTHQKQNLKSLAKDINCYGKTKHACMRLIYRQLLIIAVMEKWQIRESDLPHKIKIWYQNLGEHHSFLQGINMKKIKQNINQRQTEEKIRSSFISKVFDEINDYMRKQIDFPLANQKDTTLCRNKHQKYAKDADKVNLPLIDLLIYKREDAKLRKVRQQQQQQYYFKAMLKNKNRIKEKALLKLRKIENIQPNLNPHLQSQQKSSSPFASQCNFYPLIKRSSFVQKKSIKTRLEWFRPKQNIERSNLSNINGINLINYKAE